MLDRINALLKAAGHDKRLLPYVMRLQAARKALLAAEKVPNPAAQTSAQRLLDSIDEELGGDPLTPQQASFNAISAEVGHTPNGVATGSPVGDLGGASTASQPAADPQPMAQTAVPRMVPITIGEKELTASAIETGKKYPKEYDAASIHFRESALDSVERAKAARQAFDRLFKSMEEVQKAFLKLRLSVDLAVREEETGDYGVAIAGYRQALQECRTQGELMVKLAHQAWDEIKSGRTQEGQKDNLFDDFNNHRADARELAARLEWLDRQDRRDPDRALKFASLERDLAEILKSEHSRHLKTAQALLEDLQARLAAAQAKRKPGDDTEAMGDALAAAALVGVARQLTGRLNAVAGELEGEAAQAARARRDQKYLQAGKLKGDAIAADLEAVGRGDTRAMKGAFDDLRFGRTSLSGEQISQLYGEIIDKVLRQPAQLAILAQDPVLCGDIILMAEKQGQLDDAVLQQLGANASAVATRVLLEKTRDGVEPGKTTDWMWDAVTKEDWNAKDKGVSAQVFNSLWNQGDFDQICKLIAKDANPGQAHSLGQDTGRGSGKREGVWSGFIQPLEHLLGNYIRKVHELESGSGTFEPDMLKKVQGAQKVLKALATKGTAILTDYKDILGSKALEMFNARPGTIWGFEDVRLPYVQAAREVGPAQDPRQAQDQGQDQDGDPTRKPAKAAHGNQPLRMWELWKAVEQALNEGGYDELLKDPEAAIPRFVNKGKAAVAAEIKDSHAYPNVDIDAFLAEFEQQAGGYLKHLAGRVPSGQFDTAEASGMDPGKFMGGLGCKAGLWWAKESDKPVYYCIDGINLDEATDYKAWKNAKIRAHLEDGGSKHFEVITFAEIREILKNWKELESTVFFIEKGQPIDKARVGDWIARMQASDSKAGKRPAPAPEKFRAKLEALGGSVWKNIEADAADADTRHDAMKLAVKADALLRVARMARKDVLPRFLDGKAELLRDYGVIPAELAQASKDVLAARSAEALAQAQAGFEAHVRDLPAHLRDGLRGWAASIRVV